MEMIFPKPVHTRGLSKKYPVLEFRNYFEVNRSLSIQLHLNSFMSCLLLAPSGDTVKGCFTDRFYKNSEFKIMISPLRIY